MPRYLMTALLLLAVVVIAGIAVIVVVLPRQRAAPQAVPDHGVATTLGAPVGFEVAVSDVHMPAGGGRVTLNVTFHNSSKRQQRADPLDFSFLDRAGDYASPVFDDSCPRWTRTDLHPEGGASQPPRDADASQAGPDFGPVPLCFDVPHITGVTRLVWSPDVGLISTPVAIELR